MEQSQNARAGETGDPRENPPTSGIVLHDSYLRKSGNPVRVIVVSVERRRNEGVGETGDPRENPLISSTIKPGSPWQRGSVRRCYQVHTTIEDGKTVGSKSNVGTCAGLNEPECVCGWSAGPRIYL
ncbi:hypothetical protein PR048_029163 [Dryococelus australis]|uniref:Uncharacterized protein n=1 Tax=Dryococelus australis TaxID=614101 RepID=A0ABQ9GFY5_9NEOP|nr:hypothetical protein PR048_029163 [Dryococelus australis]